jgi:hypothetical protein
MEGFHVCTSKSEHYGSLCGIVANEEWICRPRQFLRTTALLLLEKASPWSETFSTQFYGRCVFSSVWLLKLRRAPRLYAIEKHIASGLLVSVQSLHSVLAFPL